MRASVVGMALVMMETLAPPAQAQQAGDVGVTVGYPGAIGLVWQVTGGIAVRPDFSIVRTKADSTSSVILPVTLPPGFTITPSTSTSKGWGSTTGVSVLFTVRTIDQLRLYLAPRVGYTHSTSEITTSGGTIGIVPPVASTSENETTGWLVAGSFGADYRAHDRFAVFGEVGVQYQEQKSKSTFSSSRSEGDLTQVGLRSAVGVTIYF
jgi:hypothetical protein